MIFYNGFNLLLDLVLVFIAFVIGHGIGYRKNKPPFQACWFDTPPEMGPSGSGVFELCFT